MSSVEKEEKRISRRDFAKGAAVVGAGVLASCGPTPAPQIIKETVEVPVEVTKIVKETVEVPGPAGETVYEVLPPYGKPTIEVLQPAPRLDTLEGKTICGIYGGSFHFEETWPVIVELLQKKYPTAKFVGPEELFPDQPGGIMYGGANEPALLEALPALLKQYKCDAAIVGNGC
jgi:hypothetical protein